MYHLYASSSWENESGSSDDGIKKPPSDVFRKTRVEVTSDAVELESFQTNKTAEDDEDYDSLDEDVSMISEVVPVPRVRPDGAKRSSTGGSGGDPPVNYRMIMKQRSTIRMSLRNLMAESPPSQPLSIDEDKPVVNNDRNRRNEFARQESWYKDMVSQGISDEEIAQVMGTIPEAGNAETDGNTVSTTLDQDPLLVQNSIQAQASARRMLIERLGGYDPWEQQSTKTNSDLSTATSQTSQILLPPPRSVMPRQPSSRRSLRTSEISKPVQLFTWDPKNFIDQQRQTQQLQQPLAESDLMMGTPVQKGAKPTMGFIIVRCLGCRQSQSVYSLATLVRCASCATVSPAVSLL